MIERNNCIKKAEILSTEDFVKEYAKTISSVGKDMSSLGWWSALLSSKDRFLCPLQDYFLSLESNKKNSFSKSFNKMTVFKFILAPFLFGFRSLYIRIAFYKKYQRELNSFKSKKIKVLRSFSYEKSFNENDSYRDPFWGDLIERLNEKNEVFFRVVEPIMPWNKIKENFKRVENIFISYYFVGFLDCFKAQYILLSSFFNKFPAEIKFKNFDVREEIIAQYRKDLLSVAAYTAVLNYLIYKKISKNFDIEQCLLPYEGLPWEMMTILGLREQNNDIYITGYQHAVVSPAALNYFNYHDDYSPKPNKVLTLGEVSKGIIDKFNYNKEINYQIAGALRYRKRDKVKTVSKINNRDKKVILLALEGTFVTEKFVNYMLKELLESSEWKVLIRTHPMLPFNKLEPHIDSNILKYKNFEVTQGSSLSDDLKRASVVAYWGSTVSLEALELGLPLLSFIDRESSLDYDPNYLFKKFKWTVKNPGDVKRCLSEIDKLSVLEYQEGVDLAQEYVDKYFYPINNEVLDNFLRK